MENRNAKNNFTVCELSAMSCLLMPKRTPKDSRRRGTAWFLFLLLPDLCRPFLGADPFWVRTQNERSRQTQESGGEDLQPPFLSMLESMLIGGPEEMPSMRSGTRRSQRIWSHSSHWSDPAAVRSITANINNTWSPHWRNFFRFSVDGWQRMQL